MVIGVYSSHICFK